MGNSGAKSPDIYEDEWSEPPSDIVSQSSDDDSLASAHSNLDIVGSQEAVDKGPTHGFVYEKLEPNILEAAYVTSMKNFRLTSYAFKEVITSEEGAKKSKETTQWTVPFAFRKQTDALNPLSSTLSTRTKRIQREMAALSDSLPVALDSSIFVCSDDSRPDVIKALITGPADTPYAHGCFEFDIFFPEQYPHKPPLVNMVTTGGGKCRFNPNLYANGYVCLSVINTWSGRPEEQWNPYLSLHKVLLAIQAFVFVRQPFFNEPGFRKMEGREWGEKCSRRYNARVRHATLLYAMLHQLRFPTLCFRDLIRQHCKLKRQLIFDTIDQWLQELNELGPETRDGEEPGVSTETAENTTGGKGDKSESKSVTAGKIDAKTESAGKGGDAAAKSDSSKSDKHQHDNKANGKDKEKDKKSDDKKSVSSSHHASSHHPANPDGSSNGGSSSKSSILNFSKFFSLSYVANAVAPVGGISVEGMELTVKKLRKELVKLGPIFEPEEYPADSPVNGDISPSHDDNNN